MLFFTNLIKSQLQHLVHLNLEVQTKCNLCPHKVLCEYGSRDRSKKGHSKNKKMLRNLTLCEGEIKAAVQEAIDGIAA